MHGRAGLALSCLPAYLPVLVRVGRQHLPCHLPALGSPCDRRAWKSIGRKRGIRSSAVTLSSPSWRHSYWSPCRLPTGQCSKPVRQFRWRLAIPQRICSVLYRPRVPHPLAPRLGPQSASPADEDGSCITGGVPCTEETLCDRLSESPPPQPGGQCAPPPMCVPLGLAGRWLVGRPLTGTVVLASATLRCSWAVAMFPKKAKRCDPRRLEDDGLTG